MLTGLDEAENNILLRQGNEVVFTLFKIKALFTYKAYEITFT